jgi:hypothetical protein
MILVSWILLRCKEMREILLSLLATCFLKAFRYYAKTTIREQRMILDQNKGIIVENEDFNCNINQDIFLWEDIQYVFVF